MKGDYKSSFSIGQQPANNESSTDIRTQLEHIANINEAGKEMLALSNSELKNLDGVLNIKGTSAIEIAKLKPEYYDEEIEKICKLIEQLKTNPFDEIKKSTAVQIADLMTQ